MADFGKSKYGGPFTTEQVEDVKTFLRLLVITAIASIYTDIYITQRPRDRFIKELLDINSIRSTIECYKRKIFIHIIGDPAIALLIPLHKFIIYPSLINLCSYAYEAEKEGIVRRPITMYSDDRDSSF